MLNRRNRPGSSFPAAGRSALVTLLLSGTAAASALAQQAAAPADTAPRPPAVVAPGEAPGDTVVYHLDRVVVTATRSARPVFITPAPVNLIPDARIRMVQPNTVSDLFREQPGLDVTGIGVQQPRPMIRGQRGHRILVMQDAMRLNNSRRQQDFGEIPGLVDVSSLQRVEVVRGPSSVLYGTDAIGGVVNMITRTPTEEGVGGTASYRYGSEADLHRGAGSVFGRLGAFDFQVNGSVRNAEAYSAPAGSFGNITLESPTVVNGSGVEDRGLDARLGYRLDRRHGVFLRAEQYEARNAGFGYIDPAAYAPTMPIIAISYPTQTFRKLAFGYSGAELGTPVADRADFVAYLQDNVRELNNSVRVAFQGPQVPAGAGLHSEHRSDSDVSTLGMRLEAKKFAAPWLLLTYGGDFFRDVAESDDSTTTTITGFGPPRVTVSTLSQVPNAQYRSVGGFAQGELFLGRLTLVLGSRLQDVQAETRPTEGLEELVHSKANRTMVGSANAIYALSEGLSLVGSVGSGFRSPNLIEWFFEGMATDGSGFQIRNPELEPETSVNVDLGVRFRNRLVSLEGFAFRNRVENGIRTVATGDSINQVAAYRNVNIEELIFRGIELSGDLFLPHGFSLGATYTFLETEDVNDPAIPVGDLFSRKLTGALRYHDGRERFWGEYVVRQNGEQRETVMLNNPVGDVLPGFTVHHLRGGVTVFRRGSHVQRLNLAVHNLTNELYAEASNVGFFRPEPRRNLTVTWEVGF